MLLTLLSCAADTRLPNYHEQTISNSYRGVKYDAIYPVFEATELVALNSAIQEEVENWTALFEQCCEQLEKDVAISAELQTFQRYVHVTYRLDHTNTGVAVTFNVQWSMNVGNAEPSYQRTYYLDNGFVYAKTVTVERVYS